MTTEYVETRMVALDQLTPYPGNARRGDKTRLAASLEANGQYRSLIVQARDDGELVVLCGNNTLEALEAAGEDAARCEIVRCDDATALRVNLVDNRANDAATYDGAARARLLELLDGELEGSGYTEDEADSIIAQYEEEETAPFSEPELAYNDDAAERQARVESHGGTESRTMESRGIRDVFLPYPSAQAEELGRLIMRARETWGTLSQSETVLRLARLAVAALEEPEQVDLSRAEAVYAPESAEESAHG